MLGLPLRIKTDLDPLSSLNLRYKGKCRCFAAKLQNCGVLCEWPERFQNFKMPVRTKGSWGALPLKIGLLTKIWWCRSQRNGLERWEENSKKEGTQMKWRNNVILVNSEYLQCLHHCLKYLRCTNIFLPQQPWDYFYFIVEETTSGSWGTLLRSYSWYSGSRIYRDHSHKVVSFFLGRSGGLRREKL